MFNSTRAKTLGVGFLVLCCGLGADECSGEQVGALQSSLTPAEELQDTLDALPCGNIPRTVELDPSLTYDLLSTLYVRCPVHLVGRGARLDVPLGQIGVHVLSAAGKSILEGFEVVGERSTNDPGGVAIRIEAARVNVRDVRINDIGTGILVLGCTGGEVACTAEEPAYGTACTVDADCPESGRCDPAVSLCRGRNANHAAGRNITISSCDRGVVIHGYDASAGLYEHVSVVGCDNGILDSGFTGSTWVAPHVSAIACSCAGYSTCNDCVENFEAFGLSFQDNTNYSVVTSAYLEGTPPLHSRSEATLVVGGNATSRLHPGYDGEVVGGRASRLMFGRFAYDGPGTTRYRVGPQIGITHDDPKILMNFQFDEDSPWWWFARFGSAGARDFTLSRRPLAGGLPKLDHERYAEDY